MKVLRTLRRRPDFFSAFPAFVWQILMPSAGRFVPFGWQAKRSGLPVRTDSGHSVAA